jgi:hypothetical protein
MKISDKILSIPPYISTSWAAISTIRMRANLLVITLKNSDQIEIPNLTAEIIERIFHTHATYLEKDQRSFAKEANSVNSEMPFRIGLGSIDNLGSALQHNPAQANAPDLPQEILNKIGLIAKIISPEDLAQLPKPEPHCNCMHCQIAKAILQNVQEQAKGQEGQLNSSQEELVLDEELSFRQWDIEQCGDKLFNVINRLDNKERYSVYLGEPIGCTCGKQGCEHILAVLKS